MGRHKRSEISGNKEPIPVACPAYQSRGILVQSDWPARARRYEIPHGVQTQYVSRVFYARSEAGNGRCKQFTCEYEVAKWYKVSASVPSVAQCFLFVSSQQSAKHRHSPSSSDFSMLIQSSVPF
ncbi:hypothetical protein MRB53_040872 [Persea americana]|nr:hypothetical protein MRB53_040872 [Persea americana]